MNKIIIGLTGGICSGKSVVSKIFRSFGCDVIDADIISRNVIKKGSVGEAMVAENFKDAVCDGVIDRSKLREIVFSKSIEREKLNALTHPLIQKEMERLAKESAYDVVILVVPLLFESGFNTMASVTITVSSDEKNRLNRLVKRDNISLGLAQKIIESQLSDKQREAHADYIIYNDKDIKSLQAQAKNIFEKLMIEKGI